MITPAPRLVNSTLLDKIDKLFECNVGEYVDLPQLVVVGDQSSGKSSVLEGLTGLPFPRDSGLCTRFATQITFRRARQTNITASVIPAKDSSSEYGERLKQWNKTDLQTLEAATFADIMEEVTTVMGIGVTQDEKRKTFSNDVLRLELTGPDQEHFSVIDVPGIFKRAIPNVTTKDDMAMVDQMVRNYMTNPRSVILAVIPCNADVAMQEILERAEELDPEGLRTLGVLTKPDLVDKGTEFGIIDMIEGRAHHLHLGWHLLRNPGHKDRLDTANERRRFEEAFFATTAPWNNLEKRDVGVVALRVRLQDVLENHIRREFPKVKIELDRELKSAREQLHKLGPKRQSQSELTAYMVNVAGQFSHLVDLAARAEYGRSSFFDNDESLRLATMAVNRGETFAQAMAVAGHKYQFDAKTDPRQSDEQEAPPSEEPKLEDTNSVQTRHQSDHEAIQDIVGDHAPFVKLALPQGISEWLKEVYLRSRGYELGTFDASLLGLTMKEQAAKWRDLAQGYVNDIILLVHTFFLKVLERLALNQRVRNGIKDLLGEEMRQKYTAAISHAEFLLKVELEGNPATLNHYFNDNLEKCRQNRVREQNQDRVVDIQGFGQMVRLNDIKNNNNLSNTNHVVREIHDILRSYYKLARKRFVDNVRMQVADYLLVNGPETPLTVFSAEFVAAMSADKLEEVAGEDSGVKRARTKLEKAVGELEEGKKILISG